MLVTDRLDQVHYLPHLHVEEVFVEDGRVVSGYGFFSIYYCMICITSSFDPGDCLTAILRLALRSGSSKGASIERSIRGINIYL